MPLRKRSQRRRSRPEVGQRNLSSITSESGSMPTAQFQMWLQLGFATSLQLGQHEVIPLSWSFKRGLWMAPSAKRKRLSPCQSSEPSYFSFHCYTKACACHWSHVDLQRKTVNKTFVERIHGQNELSFHKDAGLWGLPNESLPSKAHVCSDLHPKSTEDSPENYGHFRPISILAYEFPLLQYAVSLWSHPQLPKPSNHTHQGMCSSNLSSQREIGKSSFAKWCPHRSFQGLDIFQSGRERDPTISHDTTTENTAIPELVHHTFRK